MNVPVSAALALLAALCWGSGDFTGGLAARRSSPLLSVFVSYCVGLVLMVMLALVRGEQLTTAADLVWGALAGLSGMIGVGSLFRGFTQGRMGIVAPISAVLAAALPVFFEALTHGLPGVQQLFGFGVALLGIWLLSRPELPGGSLNGLNMAVLAGIGFGGFFIGLDQISANAVFWPVASGRLAAIAAMTVYALVTRQRVTLNKSPVRLFFLAGVLDVSGNLFFLLATQNGRLDVTSVLASLYPAVTAVIAWWLIKERLNRFQALGVSAAILAIVLITT